MISLISNFNKSPSIKSQKELEPTPSNRNWHYSNKNLSYGAVTTLVILLLISRSLQIRKYDVGTYFDKYKTHFFDSFTEFANFYLTVQAKDLILQEPKIQTSENDKAEDLECCWPTIYIKTRSFLQKLSFSALGA